MVEAMRVSGLEDLQLILKLQQQYLRGKATPLEEREQGFLTVAHNLETLKQMHALEPSVIIKDGAQLVAYALVMPHACSSLVPELFSMFDGLQQLSYHDRPLLESNFYVMGQVCVAKEYRSQGLFDLLYRQHQAFFQYKYDFVLTEIATRNTRSMRAHQRVGFQQLALLRDALDEWSVVTWDWQQV